MYAYLKSWAKFIGNNDTVFRYIGKPNKYTFLSYTFFDNSINSKILKYKIKAGW